MVLRSDYNNELIMMAERRSFQMYNLAFKNYTRVLLLQIMWNSNKLNFFLMNRSEVEEQLEALGYPLAREGRGDPLLPLKVTIKNCSDVLQHFKLKK